MDPVECGVCFGFKARLFQQLYATFCHGQVGVEFIVDVFGGMDVGYGVFRGIWVRCDFDFVAECGPVRALYMGSVKLIANLRRLNYHYNDVLDPICQCFITTLLPVCC